MMGDTKFVVSVSTKVFCREGLVFHHLRTTAGSLLKTSVYKWQVYFSKERLLSKKGKGGQNLIEGIKEIWIFGDLELKIEDSLNF